MSRPRAVECRLPAYSLRGSRLLRRTGGQGLVISGAERPTDCLDSRRGRTAICPADFDADRFKSWTRQDRMSPGYRVRKSWRPRRIFFRGWRRRHSGSLIHRAEPPADSCQRILVDEERCLDRAVMSPESHGVPGGVIGATMVRKVDHRDFHQWPRRRPQYPPPPNNSTTTTMIRINSIGILR